MPHFEVVDVSDWEVVNPETIGREAKIWLGQPGAPGTLCLAPSYDHASSLGFNELDVRRRLLLSRPGGLATWVGRGRAHRFEHDPDQPRSAIPSLVTTAHEALRIAGPRAAEYWLSRLDAVRPDELAAVIGRTPKLSDVAATFILEVLDNNRGRLLRDR